MKPLIYRRIIYIIFIIIFFVVSPTILLYTQGYRYNIKRGKIQKTGILIISSIPRQAEINLNNNVYEADTTPAKIKNLLPGDYDIKLIKEGYHNWQKKLPIFENTTTFAEKIILWKNNQPIIIEKNIDQNWLASPDKTKIVGINKNELLSFNLDNEIFTTIDKIDGINSSIVAWSNTSKKIILKTENKYFIYNIRLNQNKQQVANQNYSQLKWDLENDNIVYGLNKSGIWEIDLFSQEQKLVSSVSDVDDFVASGNEIYFYQNNKLYSQRKNNPVQELIEEVRCNNCKLVKKNNNNLFLIDKEDSKLFIIDQENKKETLSLEAKEISWLNEQTMLFYNDWEIWIYNLEKRDPELITRFGEQIQRVIWHPEGRHIIFVVNNKIDLMELDNRELRNVITLAEIKELDNIEINNAGKNIYFTGNYFDLEGFFKLNIK